MRGRAIARRAFVIGTGLTLIAVAVQVFFAGLGIFTTAGFALHANVGSAIVFFLPLLLLLVGWYGRVPGRLLLLTAALPGLVIVQSLLLVPYHIQGAGAWRAISALHVVNALFIF